MRRGVFYAENFYQHRKWSNPKIHKSQIVVQMLRHKRNFLVERSFNIQNWNAQHLKFSQKLDSKKIHSHCLKIRDCVRNDFGICEARNPSGEGRKIFYRAGGVCFEFSRRIFLRFFHWLLALMMSRMFAKIDFAVSLLFIV